MVVSWTMSILAFSTHIARAATVALQLLAETMHHRCEQTRHLCKSSYTTDRLSQFISLCLVEVHTLASMILLLNAQQPVMGPV